MATNRPEGSVGTNIEHIRIAVGEQEALLPLSLTARESEHVSKEHPCLLGSTELLQDMPVDRILLEPMRT